MIDIIYRNIKHAFFQPSNRHSSLIIVHFRLHSPIMINKAAHKDVQFYLEIEDGESLLDNKRRNQYDKDEIEDEERQRRVLAKLDPSAPHETMLTIDAGMGQNALAQARQFHSAVDVSGITLTKLDGTAKGGIVFAIAEELGIPIRFVGVGEGPDDLRAFRADEFVDALLER